MNCYWHAIDFLDSEIIEIMEYICFSIELDKYHYLVQSYCATDMLTILEIFSGNCIL